MNFSNRNSGSVFWITGPSGSGKTTIGKALQEQLNFEHKKTLFFDGDTIRALLNNKFGYTKEERLEVSRIYCNFCQNIADQGFNIVMACIALFHEIHIWNRTHIDNYFEVLIEVPKEELIERDSKSIYSNYSEGRLENVYGMDIEPEFPKTPDLILKNKFDDPIQYSRQILDAYNEKIDLRTR